MVVVGVNDKCILHLVPCYFKILNYTTEGSGFQVKFWLTRLCVCPQRGSGRSVSVRTFRKIQNIIYIHNISVFQDTKKWRNQWQQISFFDLLVKEVFVHNSWNVKQGISHPKECVFTVRRQKHIVLCTLPLTSSAFTEDTDSLPQYRKSSVSDQLS